MKTRIDRIQPGFLVFLLLFAADPAQGGETLQKLSPSEKWACIKAHPAVVNPVGRDPDDESVLSLRGEWDFRPTTHRTYGNSPGREFLDLSSGKGDFWTKDGKMTRRDGELRTLHVPGCWEAQGVGTSATGIPCYIKWDVSPKPMNHVFEGVGWYRKNVQIPASWAGKRIWLKTGWVNSVGMFWVNGNQVAYNNSYCGTYKYEVTDFVMPGSNAVITVEVMNMLPSRRGNMNSINHWGGILRDIEFEATPQTFIDDAWVRGVFDEKTAEVNVIIGTAARPESSSSLIRVTIDETVIEQPLSRSQNYTLAIPLARFRPWSPEHPNLYWAKIELLQGGKVVQTRRERFGVRKLEVRGTDFYLNGKPFFMRGAGWHFIDPVEGAALADREIWLWKAKKVRSAGFNIVRTHTMCYMPEFFEACDEVGLMVQPELPYYTDIPRDAQSFDPSGDAKELYEHFRRYPSFAVYSGGNEGWFGPRLTRLLYSEIRSRDPDRLMVGQDTWLNDVNNQPGMTDFSGGPMSVWPRGSVRLASLPMVCHEYLNLCVKLDSRLEPKYTGLYEPSVTRTARAEWLAKFGLDHSWGDRLQDAQHMMQAVWRKYGFEAARIDPFCDGYSYWSLLDVASPQKGTFTGQSLFDPFWGEKSNGEKVSDIAVYNSSSCVLLTDGEDPELWPDGIPRPDGFKMFVDRVATNRVRCVGETLSARFHFAHYGENPLKDAALEWRLVSKDGSVLASGERAIGNQPLGQARVVALENIVIPSVAKPCRAQLVATVSADGFCVSNSWSYWLFPRREIKNRPEVACADAFAAALSVRYRSLLAERDWRKAKVVVAPHGSELEKDALAAGKSVVSLANQTGAPDIFLGWWWMGDQMGAALGVSPLLGRLPEERFLCPLFFRIGKTGLKMPVEGFEEMDLVMVGEGADACFLYLADSHRSDGVRRVLVAGLDVLSDTAEGSALLDGILDEIVK